LFIPHSVESTSEKKRKNTGKTIEEKLEVFREVEKNEISKSKIAKAYGILVSTLSMYLKSQDSTEQQASQWHIISKHMGTVEDTLFE
jgi:DNA invertase Pin-like site-specific DNA recombinase